MSSDSSESDRNTKVYKLRSRKNFQTWKQKTLSLASSKGYERFLLEDVSVDSDNEIDNKEADYINETDDDERRKKKVALSKAKKNKKKSLEAAAMLTCSVKSKDLKMIAKCKNNPFKMFEVICKKYGSREDSDLTELLDDFADCKLKSKKHDPDDWFAELEQVNEHLKEIDKDFAKSDKELCSHVLKNLPKGYSGLKTVIQLMDDHLDNYEGIKKTISKHWRVNHRKSKGSKKKKQREESESESNSENSDSEESSSSSDSSVHEKRKKKKKDKYALTVTKGDDYKNKHGTIVCGHCGKTGHGKVNCWELHGKPEKKQYKDAGSKGNRDRKCWICGSDKHLVRDCPKKKDGSSDDDDAEAQINTFFHHVNVVTVNEETTVERNESNSSNDETNKRRWCCSSRHTSCIKIEEKKVKKNKKKKQNNNQDEPMNNEKEIGEDEEKMSEGSYSEINKVDNETKNKINTHKHESDNKVNTEEEESSTEVLKRPKDEKVGQVGNDDNKNIKNKENETGDEENEYIKPTEEEARRYITEYEELMDREWKKTIMNKLKKEKEEVGVISDDEINTKEERDEDHPLMKLFHKKRSNEVKMDTATKELEEQKDDEVNNNNFFGLGLAGRNTEANNENEELSHDSNEYKSGARTIGEGEVIYGTDIDGKQKLLKPGAVIYNRDPYETDTDQSGCSNSSDEETMITEEATLHGNDEDNTNADKVNDNVGIALRDMIGVEAEEEKSDIEEVHEAHDTIIEEATTTEARAFVQQHWGEEIALQEFPLSREESEQTNEPEFEEKEMESDDVDETNEINVISQKVYEVEENDEVWLADTGASCHVTFNAAKIVNIKKTDNDTIIVGDKRKCNVTRKGDLMLSFKNGENCIKLKDVRVVDQIGKNIISIGTLLNDGGKMLGTDDALTVKYKGVTLKFKRNEKDGLYYMKLKRIKSENQQQCYEVAANDQWKLVGKNNKVVDKSNWQKMSKTTAHEKWGHQHEDQLMKMANNIQLKLTGQLGGCAGCALIKSRAKATTKTTTEKATVKGQRLFIDTTGPYPASRGGMRYWMCAVDDLTDMTWTYFATSKSKMTEFVSELVTIIKGQGNKVKYIRCDNAGEHQTKLKELCNEEGITLEYTAPNTPQQNGRAEKKIHILWQRSMTMMVQANLTKSAQNKFWAEAVACSNFLENLTIKKGRNIPALEAWTGKSVRKWMKHLIQFGRVGVANDKGKKIKGKMDKRGFTIMMVGYAMNHGAGTYRVFNPKTNRIIFSRDVTWDDFKPKSLNDALDVYSESEEDSSYEEESSISSEEYDLSDSSDDESSEFSSKKKGETKNNKSDDYSSSSSGESRSSSETSNSNKSSESGSSDSTSESDESDNKSAKQKEDEDNKSKFTNNTEISKPRAKRRETARRKAENNAKKSRTPPTTISVRKTRSMNMKLRSGRNKNNNEILKKVTGDTKARRVTIEEGEKKENSVNYIDELTDFELSESTLDRLYNLEEKEQTKNMFEVYTMELIGDDDTPKTIKEALACKDKKFWKKSAIAEINNFLKRKTWRFVRKLWVKSIGRRTIAVKWVFKIKHEPDFSLRYKSRVVSKGFMQIPGVDYTEKFSPVAQPTTVRIVLVMVLWYGWGCELVDIEAAFLEGKLTNSTYIDLPPGMIELGFMTEEEYRTSCIELNGGMYGNVDSALMYFVRFRDYATKKEGLDLRQSSADPCLFYRVNESNKTIGVIVVYVDDCLIAGEKEFIEEMKMKLKQEFGVVEDGQLRKLLGVRYNWVNLEDKNEAKVILSMDDKAKEIVQAFEKARGHIPKKYSTPGKPSEVLKANVGEIVMHKEYRSILGKVMFYTTKVAPECSFACGQLARQMHRPGKEHWNAMERIVGYINSKERHELVIKRPKEIRVVSFSDSSYGDCEDSRRSSTGDIHTIGGSIISWRAQRTKCVCLSSTEAEYVGLTATCKEQRFIQMVLEEVFSIKKCGILYEDNEAAIYLTKNHHVSPRTKHIDIRQHYIRNHISEGYGEARKIGTEENFADILTKNVSVCLFERMSEAILNGFKGHDDKFTNFQREND